MKTQTEKVGRFEFQVNIEKCYDDKKFSCHIPAYDIYFSAENKSDVSKKSIAMVKMWMGFYKVK